MTEPKVLFEREGNVLVIIINRPQARNSVDLEVCLGIGEALEHSNTDPDVRAIVLTGTGDLAFSAGADLKAIARGDRMLPPGREHWSFAGFVHHFTSKPTIAAVNGAALGGGTELALAADLVVAAEHAVFGLPEVKRGLIAAAGGTFRVVDQLPRKIALELLLTGDPITAVEAHRWGLVNRVVPTGQARAVAVALAQKIAANAPLAVQASKRLAYGMADGVDPEIDSWAQNDREISALIATHDAQEGPRAFAEKREPQWLAR